jgi:tRNA modification GTPase
MAGLGRPGSPVEREGIRRGKKIAAEADALLLLLDGSRRLAVEDRALVESYRKRKVILVLNKTDLPEKTTLADVSRIFPGLPAIGISALKGNCLAGLRAMIHDLFLPLIPSGEIVIFRKRDKLLLEELSARLDVLKEMVAGDRPIETVAEEARGVVAVISRLTGKIRADDVLDDIFSRFCIGK